MNIEELVDVICHHEVIKCHFHANGGFPFVLHVETTQFLISSFFSFKVLFKEQP